MQRGLLAVAAAALLCGLCYLALRGLVANGQSVQDIVLMTCGATLALAAIATGFSARAFLRSSAIEKDLALLSRSVDGAMRDLSARGNRETATLEELNAFVTREMELFSARTPLRPRQPVVAGESTPTRDNIVALSASRKVRPETAGVVAPLAAPEQAGFELAVQRAFASGPPEISLQPIVSISEGAAVGFEVHAHVERDGGAAIDLQRLPSSLTNVSQAAFERWLVVGAVDAAKKQIGAMADGLPLHVQVSEALLSDSDELTLVVGSLRTLSRAADAIVLSMPSSVVERNARHSEALELLVDCGVRLAAGSWSGNKETLEKLRRSGVSQVKLSADRLLGRSKLTRSATSAIRMVEIASALDMQVVAVNVTNDEDAVSLIDLGINLMTGNRFSGPRRLRPHGEGKAEKAARV